MKRANYQLFVWKQVLNSNFDSNSSFGHDWQDNERRLEIFWMDHKPCSESMLEFITCNCWQVLYGDDCQLSIECTNFCMCNDNCENEEDNGEGSNNEECEGDESKNYD